MGDIHTIVHQHLSSVKQNPSKPLDELLLRKVDEKFADGLSEGARTQLLGAVQELLPTLQQDATPITSLVIRLIQPATVTFEQVDALLTQNGSSNEQYLKGFESLDKDVNILTLNLLNKAVASPSGIGLVASKHDVVQSWIKRWLSTPEINVGERATKVLEDFLLAGADSEQATVEKNLMVRRIFHDRDIYESIFSLCSLKTMGLPGQPDKNQKTIAQARLLELLVKVDHSNSPIRISQFPDIEQRYDVTDSTQGILYFAFTKMVDYTDDDLVLSAFIGFCSDYLVRLCPWSSERPTFALKFLKDNHLHEACMSYFLNPSADHLPFLLSDSATYLQRYCGMWQDDLLNDDNLCAKVTAKLSRQFKNASKADWHSSDALRSDLAVLGALPRCLHLPGFRGYRDVVSPLFDVPADTYSPYVIDQLRLIFCEKIDSRAPTRATIAEGKADRMIKRLLYLYYYERNPGLWSHLVKVADTVALTHPALAAVNFMIAFAVADWEVVDKHVMPSLPSEEELSRMRGGVAAPTSGIDALIFERGVAEIVLPYVLAPPRSFSLSVQARASSIHGKDPTQTIAKAKSELTSCILDLLQKKERTPEMEQMLEVFTRQVERNSRTEVTQGPGESIATMRR